MSRSHGKSILILVFIGVASSLSFQNCSVAPDTKSSNNTAQSNVTVICSPANDCLKYRLTTYPFNNNDCLGSSNKVQLDNMATVNGGQVTNILWNSCQSQTATEACCPQGLITGSFRTFLRDRSLSVSFENNPGNIYNTSNKTGVSD